jgi:hypothetical protein
VTIDGVEMALNTTIDVGPGLSHLKLPREVMSGLTTGLYLAGPVAIRDAEGGELTTFHRAIPKALFELRDSGSEPSTASELLDRYRKLGQERDRQLNEGLGEGPEVYQALVFVRDCLITRRMFLGPYEILPLRGLGIGDEVESVESFLASEGLPPLPDLSSGLQQARLGQPVFVLHCRAARGTDVEGVGEGIEAEADLLASLLSVHRSGYGSVFASFLIHRATGQTYFRFASPSYRGNLLGGPISGEHPPTIRWHLNRLRDSDTLQLYVGLYREALREANEELQYFRYWSLLETVARGKGYVGHPKRDWSGNIVLNRKGKPMLIKEAEDLVVELLKDQAQLADNSLAQGLAQGLLSQQVPIWYRRRNCIVHGGECLCRDPTVPIAADSKYANCWAARREVASGSTPPVDGYLNSLREVASLTLAKELGS